MKTYEINTGTDSVDRTESFGDLILAGDVVLVDEVEHSSAASQARFLLEEYGVKNPESLAKAQPKQHNLVDTRPTRHGPGTAYAGPGIRMPFTAY